MNKRPTVLVFTAIPATHVITQAVYNADCESIVSKGFAPDTASAGIVIFDPTFYPVSPYMGLTLLDITEHIKRVHGENVHYIILSESLSKHQLKEKMRMTALGSAGHSYIDSGDGNLVSELQQLVEAIVSSRKEFN